MGDCAALLRTSIPASRRACVSQTELLALAAQLAREPTVVRARRLARRLLGWEGLPEAWVDAAIEAALGEAGGLASASPPAVASRSLHAGRHRSLRGGSARRAPGPSFDPLNDGRAPLIEGHALR